MQRAAGHTSGDPAALKRATVGASAAAAVLVLGGWTAVNASTNDDPVDVVAAAQERPIEDQASVIIPVLPKPATAAARATAPRRAPKVVPVPVVALYRAPACAAPAKGAAAAKGAGDALKTAAAAVALLGADYPDIYSGHVACAPAGRLVVYRLAGSASTFDGQIQAIAERQKVTIKLAKAPFSRQQLATMAGWITERRAAWTAGGTPVRGISLKPNGTLEVSADSADVAALAKRLVKFRTQVRVVPYVRH